MVDSACKTLALKQVTDYNDVKGTQLCVGVQMNEEPYLLTFDFSTKLEDLSKAYSKRLESETSNFDQGDTLLFYRAFELSELSM